MKISGESSPTTFKEPSQAMLKEVFVHNRTSDRSPTPRNTAVEQWSLRNNGDFRMSTPRTAHFGIYFHSLKTIQKQQPRSRTHAHHWCVDHRMADRGVLTKHIGTDTPQGLCASFWRAGIRESTFDPPAKKNKD